MSFFYDLCCHFKFLAYLSSFFPQWFVMHRVLFLLFFSSLEYSFSSFLPLSILYLFSKFILLFHSFSTYLPSLSLRFIVLFLIVLLSILLTSFFSQVDNSNVNELMLNNIYGWFLSSFYCCLLTVWYSCTGSLRRSTLIYLFIF